jgi:hypothetical protein
MLDTYYYYEAKSFIGDISLHLTGAYKTIAIILTVLAAIVTFGLVLFTAISIKRARPFGILVALAQPVGIVSAMLMVFQYGKIDFSSLEMTVTSQVSLEDAMSKLYEQMGEVFIANILPQLALYIVLSVVLFVVTLLTVIYAILLIKAKPGTFSVIALIVTLVRHFFIAPVEFITLFLMIGSPTIQTVWDLFYKGAYLLPLLLMAVQGILVLSRAAKAKKAAALADSAEQTEEASA